MKRILTILLFAALTLTSWAQSVNPLDLLKAEPKRAYGTDFPCMIRADKNTPHKHVAKVMNLCAAAGMWKVSFVAIQEHKANK